MNSKRFTMKDDEFICEMCGKRVYKLEYSARDHCPFCLHSKHVDINPGDRLENCKGILKPVGVEKGKKDTYKIVYKCLRCGKIRKNVMSNDDNFDKILEIVRENSI